MQAQGDFFLRLQALLEPFGITRYDMDGWGTYERHVDAEQHTVGQEYMPRIESRPINLQMSHSPGCSGRACPRASHAS
jgi:IS1 family transposase